MAEQSGDIPEIFKETPKEDDNKEDIEDRPKESLDSKSDEESEHSEENSEEESDNESEDESEEESDEEDEVSDDESVPEDSKTPPKELPKNEPLKKPLKTYRKTQQVEPLPVQGPEIMQNTARATILKPRQVKKHLQNIRLINEGIVDIAVLLCGCIDTETFKRDDNNKITDKNEQRRILKSITPIIYVLDKEGEDKEKKFIALISDYKEVKKMYEKIIKRLILERLIPLLQVTDSYTIDGKNKKMLKRQLDELAYKDVSDYEFIVNANVYLSKYMTKIHRHKYKRLCNTKKIQVKRADGKIISKIEPNNVQFKSKNFQYYSYQEQAFENMKRSIEKVLNNDTSGDIYEKNLRGYLLYWMLGSGKTCTVINIAEKYIAMCKKMGKKPVVNVFCLASLRNNFIAEYCDLCGENRAHIYKYYNFFAYNDGSVKPGFADGFVDDSLIIIDEVQVLLNGKKNSLGSNDARVYSIVYDTIQKSKGSFITCLSGTPIYSSEYEICLLAGLINPVHNTADEKMSIVKNIKAGNSTILLNVQDFDLGPVSQLDGGTSIDNTFLYRVFKHCVSYVSKSYASREVNIDSKEDDESTYPSIEEEFIYVELPKDQQSAAISEREKEMKKSGKKTTEDDKKNYIKYVKLLSRRCENIFYDESRLLGEDEEAKNKGKKLKEKVKTDIIDQLFVNHYFTEDDKLVEYEDDSFCQKFSGIINDLRSMYSAKFADIILDCLKIVQMKRKDPRKGKIVIYSENVNGAGIKFFEEVFKRFNINVLMYTGEVSDSGREENRKNFNDTKTNLLGEKYPILLVSSAGSTGISLKCVRYLYIVEPGLNELVTYQVKGRVRRAHSHDALPPDMRNVTIKRYISVDYGTKSSISNKRNSSIVGKTSQLWADSIGLQKFNICKKMFRLLRYASIEYQSKKYTKKDIDSLDVI